MSTAKKPKKAKPSAPTDAEMKRLVEAWAKAKGIDSPGLSVSTWTNGGGEDVLVVREEPDSPPPTAQERREREQRHQEQDEKHARGSFIKWWGEFVAVVNDLYDQLAEIEESPWRDDLRRSGVDVVRLHNLYVEFDELSTRVMKPPFDSPIRLQKPYGLMIGKKGE